MYSFPFDRIFILALQSKYDQLARTRGNTFTGTVSTTGWKIGRLTLTGSRSLQSIPGHRIDRISLRTVNGVS